MSSAATLQRKKRYRERQRESRVVVSLDVSLDVVLWLESEGHLGAQFEQDREAVAKALSRYIENAMSAAAERQPGQAVRLVKETVQR